MTRVLEAEAEDRALRQRSMVIKSVYGALEAGVQRAGGELLGFSVSYRVGDVLMTLRVQMPAGRMVGFVGATDLPGVFIKAARETAADQVRWKQDHYSKNGR